MGTYYDLILNYTVGGQTITLKILSAKGEGFIIDLWKVTRGLMKTSWRTQVDFYQSLLIKMLSSPDEQVQRGLNDYVDARIYLNLHVEARRMDIAYAEKSPGSDHLNRHHENEEDETGTHSVYRGWLDDPQTTEFFVTYVIGHLELDEPEERY